MAPDLHSAKPVPIKNRKTQVHTREGKRKGGEETYISSPPCECLTPARVQRSKVMAAMSARMWESRSSSTSTMAAPWLSGRPAK